jgi:hypothetical protein
MKRFMIQLNRSLSQPLLHPCENVHFLSQEDAERHVQMLKQDPNNKYPIIEYKICEIDVPSVAPPSSS